jgi:precorrin-6A/cobalt-precorrin-6A reductase
MRILILGGTGEGRELAEALASGGHEVVTSLAGRTSSPMVPQGEIRVGKFGGVPGLVGYLRAMRIERVIDATHPYSGLISANAVAAARQAGIRLVRLTRPVWEEPTGGRWSHVPDVAAAAKAIPEGSVALITTGHEGLEKLLARNDCELIVRLIEPPDISMPAHARLVLGRPPYSLDDERHLFEAERIRVLVTKNSGGQATRAKLLAAAELGVRVVVIDRPILPGAVEAGSVEQVIAAITDV